MFSRKNMLWMAVGLLLLVAGYVLLGQGPVDSILSKSVAPVVLAVAYLAVLPLALMARERDEGKHK